MIAQKRAARGWCYHPADMSGRFGAFATRSLSTLPVLLAVSLVPLIVYLRPVQPTGAALDYWNGQSVNYDFFSFYKARLVVILGAAAVLAAALTWRRWTREAGRNAHLPAVPAVAVGVFVAMTIASTVLSAFPDIALNGYPDRYEGLWVQLAYVALLVCAFGTSGSDERLRLFAGVFGVSAIVVGLVGVLQFAGLDPFRTGFGRLLILPASSEALAPSLLFTQFTDDPRSVYSTLYHYNYVGSYTALALPFFLALLVRPAPRVLRGIYAAAVVLLAVCWAACGSRAGLVGGATALAVLALVHGRPLFRRWRWWVPALAALLVAVVAADMATGWRIAGRLRSTAVGIARGSGPGEATPPFTLAGIDGRRIRLARPDGEFAITEDRGNLAVIGFDGTEMGLVVEPQGGAARVKVDHPAFAALELVLGRIRGRPGLVVRQGAYALNFLITADGFRQATLTGLPYPPEPVRAWGFEGRERMGSARGYIWSRSLPLLRRTWLLGTGPDTFAAVFPQHDYAGKFAVYGTTEMLVDKAHNLYLQAAINNGGVAALALVVLLGWFLASAGRRLARRVSDGVAWTFGLASFAGVLGYAIAGLFNDSAVCVAPVFWVVLGLGLRVTVENDNGSGGPTPGTAVPTKPVRASGKRQTRREQRPRNPA